MKTRVTVTLEDNNPQTMQVEGERIAQVVIGMLRFAQLSAEQEANLNLLAKNVNSNPVVVEILRKIAQLQVPTEFRLEESAPPTSIATEELGK